MFKHAMILAGSLMSLLACTNGPNPSEHVRPDISTLHEFTACRDVQCIDPIAESTGRCYVGEFTSARRRYYLFEACDPSQGPDDIEIGFGKNGTELIAFIRTSHQAYAEGLFAQAQQMGYLRDKGSVEVDGDFTRWWFDLSDRPDSRLMWETLEESDGHKNWDIGIVWEAPA